MKKSLVLAGVLAVGCLVGGLLAAEMPATAGALQPQSVKGTWVCRDQAYGPRQLGAGAAHADVAQTYDLYLPAPVGKIKADAPFFLFVHGGAWSAGSKRDAAMLHAEMASKGFVVVSMNYQLSAPNKGGFCSFARMLQDIDLMVAHLPSLCVALKLKAPGKIAIGGMSAGGHLALLYAYDGANPKVLNLGLKHALPIGCVFSDGGPADLSSPEFAVAGLDCMKGNLEHWLMQFNALAGAKMPKLGLKESLALQRAYSPVSLIDAKAPPTICLYGETHRVPTARTFAADATGRKESFATLWQQLGKPAPETVGTDGIVSSQSFTALTNGLARSRVPYAARLTKFPHCSSLVRDPKLRPWLYQKLKEFLR